MILKRIASLVVVVAALLTVEFVGLVYQPTWRWCVTLGLSALLLLASYAMARNLTRRILLVAGTLTVAYLISATYFEAAFLTMDIGGPAFLYGLLYAGLTTIFLVAAYRILASLRRS